MYPKAIMRGWRRSLYLNWFFGESFLYIDADIVGKLPNTNVENFELV